MSGLFDQGQAEEPEGVPAGETEAQRRDAAARARPPDPAGTQPRSIVPAVLPKAFEIPGPPALGPGTGVLADSAGGDGAIVASGPPVEAPHAARFQFLVGALIALGLAAAAITLGVLARPGAGPSVPWSDWHPVNNGVDPAQQIADHVAPEYKLDTGQQLVQVTGGPLAVRGAPVIVAVQQSGSNPTELSGNGVFYDLCGQGTSCSISSGKPSTQRALLLRREALELALYSFRYIDGVSQVVVKIPPPPPATAAASGGSGSAAGGTGSSAGATGTGSSAGAGAGGAGAAGASTSAAGAASTGSGASGSGSSGSSSTSATATPRALFFRPANVASQLSQPLGVTLSNHTPTVATITSASDTRVVDQLTKHALYDFTLTQDQSQNQVLLLVPPALGG